VSSSTPLATAFAILSVLTLACQESLGPTDAPGTYVLRRVERDPLPTVLYDNEIYAVRVIADTIRLRPDGTGIISGVYEAVPLHEGLPAEGPVYSTTSIRYRAVRDQLEIEYVCPDLANCLPPPHLIARRLPSGLTVRWGPSLFGRSPLLYVSIGAAP
jgi:hypothetical protein